MARTGFTLCAVSIAALVLAGCEDGALKLPGTDDDTPSRDAGAGNGESITLVERDVEAPDVFQLTERGLWDGRPSLGGVWVAHPDVGDPERVIIRNPDAGTFVIGALFRREREQAGPPLQVSSDAAQALELVAGQPTELNVTALRREEVAEDADPDTAEAAIETASLDDAPVADATPDAADQPDEAAATPATPAPVQSDLDRPYIQIGIFSVEENASATGERMREAGLLPNLHEEESQGQAFWRVTVGPARNARERDALLETVKEMGFNDAYFAAR